MLRDGLMSRAARVLMVLLITATSIAGPVAATTEPPGEPPGTLPTHCAPGILQPCFGLATDYGELTLSPNIVHEGDLVTATWSPAQGGTTAIWPDEMNPGDEVPGLKNHALVQTGPCVDGDATCTYRVVYSLTCLSHDELPAAWGHFGIRVAKQDDLTVSVDAPIWFAPESFTVALRVEDPDGAVISTPISTRLQRPAVTVTTFGDDTVIGVRRRAGLGSSGGQTTTSLITDPSVPNFDLRAENPDLAASFDSDRFAAGLEVHIPAIDHRSYTPFAHAWPGIWDQPGSNFGCFRRGTWTLTVTAPGYRESEPVTFTVPDATQVADHAQITVRLRHPLEPRADFGWTPIAPAGSVRFEDASTRGNGGHGQSIENWVWDFGDGQTGAGSAIVHPFDLPGDYVVGLTITDGDGLQSTISKTVGVEAPTLDVQIEGNFADRAVGAVVPVTLTLSASDGLGPLTLHFLGDPLTAFPAASATVAGITSPGATFELQPGASLPLQGTVTLRAGGAIQLSSRVLGQDAAGRAVDKLAQLDVGVEPPGLKLTVSGQPCSRTSEGSPPRCVVDFAGHRASEPLDVTVEVKVENTSPDQPITNVTIEEALAITAVAGTDPDHLSQVGGPSIAGGPAPGGAIGDLGPGASKTVTYRVRATGAGRYVIEARASGDVSEPDGGGDGGGGGGPAGLGPATVGLATISLSSFVQSLLTPVRTVATTRVSATGRLALDVGEELTVTITPSRNDFKLESDDEGNHEPEEIDVRIAVKNVTDQPIANVIIGALDLSAADPDQTYHPFPASVIGDNAPNEVGTIAPDETKTVTRRVRVTADGHMKLTTLVTSDALPATGEKALTATVTTLLTMHLDGEAQRQVVAGSAVTFSGTFRNVSNDRTVAITDPMSVRRDGNVIGGGMIAEVGDAADPFPRPLIAKLAPGEEVNFGVLFRTERPTIADYDGGTANSPEWSRATINFNVWIRAATREDDGTWEALSEQTPCGCEYPGSVAISGGDFGQFEVVIDTTEIVSDGGQVGSAMFGLSVGALEGAQRRLSGLLTMATNVGRFLLSSDFRDETMSKELIKGRLKDALDYLSEFAVWLPAAEADEVAATVGTKLADAYAAFRETVTSGIPHPEDSRTAAALTAMAREQINHLQGAWRRGDPNELIDAVMPVGGIVGEQVTDVLVGEAVFEALAHLATVPRYVDLAAANWRDARTIAEMQAKLPSLAVQADLLDATERSKSNFVNLENAYQARRELSIAELGGAENGAGLSRDSIRTAEQWTRDNPNQVIALVPNEPQGAVLRDLKLAVGKIEPIKPKSMSTIEYLVFGGRAEDRNAVILRRLQLSEAEVDARVSQLIAAGELAEEDRAVAKQILKSRNGEWKVFTDRGIKNPTTGEVTPDPGGIGKLKAYDETGKIPNQFRGEDNDIAFSGPKQNLGFKLEYYKDGELLPAARIGEADYVVLLQEHPTTGRLVKIVGDDDGLFIGLLNGLGLAPAQLEAAYSSIWEAFNHPFSDTWLAHIGSEVKAKLKIFSRYFTTTSEGTAGAPLVVAVNGKFFAAKIDPYLSRFDPLNNRAYIKWVGLPQAVDPIRPGGWLNAVLRPLANVPWPATFLRSFLHIPGAATNPDIPPIPSAKRARVLRVNEVGHVESWTPTTGWHSDPAAEAEAGAGTIAVAPQTQVFESTAAGATRVEISSQEQMGLAGDWFEVGDEVVLDPGGPHEETATIAGFGSLVFEVPLQFAHGAGELITLMPKPADTNPPVIAFTGLRTYRLLETVAVGCTFDDPGSGIHASACTVPAPAPAWRFGPGPEAVSAWAMDNAGNQALATGAFTVTATYRDLCALTEAFSSKKNEKDLCNQLEHAQKEAAKGKAREAAKHIDEYVKKVQKDRKAFTRAEADMLIAFARSL